MRTALKILALPPKLFLKVLILKIFTKERKVFRQAFQYKIFINFNVLCQIFFSQSSCFIDIFTDMKNRIYNSKNGSKRRYKTVQQCVFNEINYFIKQPIFTGIQNLVPYILSLKAYWKIVTTFTHLHNMYLCFCLGKY